MRESLDETMRDAIFQNFGSSLTHRGLHHIIKFDLKLFLIASALSDLLLDLDSDRVVKSHAPFLAIEGVFRDGHVRVLLDLRVEILLRLEHNSTRVVELLDVIASDLCEFGC